MRRVCTGLAFSLLLASCDWLGPAPQPSPTPTPSITPSASASATVPASGARSVQEETDDFRFEYAYPAEAGNLPELAALLDGRLDRLRTRLAAQSAEGRDAARGNGFPFNKYSESVEWKVVADTPRFLSLSAEISSYTGGAHGNYGFDSLVWDKEAGQALAHTAFFTSLPRLEQAVGKDLCDLLNAERAKRRGENAEAMALDDFNECVSLEDVTVLLGSSNGRAFNRIGVQIGPYVAGPYVEGSWEFTLPVTADVFAAVKPEYQDAFAVRN
jgi:hypothetical protein